MQAPRMLPLLISILAMPISLPMPILPGPSGMPVIMVVVLAMFSPVQAIIAAEAGVNAKAESIAVVIKILISILPGNETSILLANEIRFRRPKRFRRNKFLCAAMQRNRCRAMSSPSPKIATPAARPATDRPRQSPGSSRGFSNLLISQGPDRWPSAGFERNRDQRFDRSPIAPVAISVSHDALPRSGAWHL